MKINNEDWVITAVKENGVWIELDVQKEVEIDSIEDFIDWRDPLVIGREE